MDTNIALLPRIESIESIGKESSCRMPFSRSESTGTEFAHQPSPC